jgi:hypothetical protein
VFGNLSFVSSCPDVVDAVYMFQSQGLATNIVSSSRNVIGQYDLALKCGTDRDDETTVRSYSFLRHTPFCAYQRYFGYCLIYWHSFGILATETSHLVDELSSQLPISSLCFSAMAALGPGFNQSNGGSPAPTTPRGQASKEINAIVELTASEFELPLRSRVGTFPPSKRPDGYAERCVDHINFLFFRNRIVMNYVFNQFRKDRADGCISGDLLEAFYTRTRDAVYLEKHKPQLEKLQLNKTTAQQDPQSKKPAPKLSLTQTKLIPTIKRSPWLDYVKDVDIENASPKAKLLPVNQSFVSEYESVTRGTKRISDQETCISSKYVRPQKQQRQQLSLDNHFSCKISLSNSSHAPSNQTNTASVYPGNANQRFATTVATSFNSIYDEWDSSSADYGDEPDPSQAAQIEQIMTSFEQPSCGPEDSGVVNDSFTKCEAWLNGESFTHSSFTSNRSEAATTTNSDNM